MSEAAAAAAAARIPDDWKPKIEREIQERFGTASHLEIFKTALQEAGAVLAGGFPLSCVAPGSPFSSSDMDIYCPVLKIPMFLAKLFIILGLDKPHTKTMRLIPSSLYSRSFLRRNGIRRIYRLKGKNYDDVDVMSVRKKRTVTDVCSNFDLTFCEIWYDGNAVHATHPEHIQSRRGFLRKDYIPLMLQRNSFLRERAIKYKNRGFTIDYDPEFVPTPTPLPPLMESLAYGRVQCEAAPDDLQHRFRRHMLAWLERYQYLNDTVRPFYFYNNPNLRMVSPDVQHNGCAEARSMRGILEIKNFMLWKIFFEGNSQHFFLADGYDSEDLEDDMSRLKRQNHKANRVSPAYKNELELAPPTEQEEVWIWRMLNKMYYHYVKNDIQYGYERLAGLLNRRGRSSTVQTKILPFVKYMYEHCMRKGTDNITAEDNVTLFDIHQHPLEGAISREGLEAYLTDHIRDVDKESVPCYHRPNTDGHGNCTQTLSLKDVKLIVSPAFYKRYTAPSVLESGLDQVIPAYDSLLFNTRSLDPQYGNIFHISICPFCLQLERREEGCTYLTHANPKGLPTTQSPYCSPLFSVETVLEKYRSFVEAMPITATFDRRFPQHYQFCAECGAPCINHRHFDLEHPGRLLPEAMRNGHFDYGTCPGGGRRSLIARVLAIREVFSDMSVSHPKEERLIAAERAELAAVDPAYLARADAILAIAAPAAAERAALLEKKTAAPLAEANEASLRRINAMAAPWNVPVPSQKTYTDTEAAAVAAAPRNERAEGKEGDGVFDAFLPPVAPPAGRRPFWLEPNNDDDDEAVMAAAPPAAVANIENNADGVGGPNENEENRRELAAAMAAAAPAAAVANIENNANGVGPNENEENRRELAAALAAPPNAADQALADLLRNAHAAAEAADAPPAPPAQPPPEGGRRHYRRTRRITRPSGRSVARTRTTRRASHGRS